MSTFRWDQLRGKEKQRGDWHLRLPTLFEGEMFTGPVSNRNICHKWIIRYQESTKNIAPIVDSIMIYIIHPHGTQGWELCLRGRSSEGAEIRIALKR